MFKPHFGNCSCCGKPGLIVVKAGLRKQCNEQKKKENKRDRKHVNPKLFKSKSIKDLVKELDGWFSLFIRLRYADKNGMVKCFTSGEVLHYKKAQAGHFISRRHMATRWDEINVQVQTVRENIFNQGNGPVFAQKLKEKYGETVLDLLLMKKNNKFQLDKFKMDILIKEYKEKVQKLKDNIDDAAN